MKPQEVAISFEMFKAEAAQLDDNGLVDAWIELKNKTEVTPDLDLLKSQYLEVALVQRFGLMEWYKVVEARRQARLPNQAETDKK